MKENPKIEAEIAALDREIGSGCATADAYWRRGRLLWKLGRRGEAMSDYAEAAALDPGSPAVQALEQSRSIMQFYNKDLYNP